AVAGGEDAAILPRVGAQDGSYGCIDLCVHQHDMLAVFEGLERDSSAVLDRTSRVNKHVDEVGARQQHGILCRRRLAGADGVVELGLGLGDARGLKARVAQYAESTLRPPVGDRANPYPRYAVCDLVRKPLAHEAGTDDSYTDRPALGFASLERGVDNQHGAGL